MHALDPILVVDDTLPYRQMVASILAPRGHRVTTAADGLEALDRLRATHEPHVVLLDIVMPRLDGIGLWREIQSNPVLSGAGHRVIFMSTSSRLNAPSTPPAHGHLAKPFTREQLLAAIEATRLN